MTRPPLAIVAPNVERRPEIRCTSDLHDAVTDARKSLVRDPDLYQSGQGLVTIATPRTGPDDGDDGPEIRPVPRNVLAARMSAIARYMRPGKGGRWVAIEPPKNVVAAVHELGDWPEVRPIVAVRDAPTMRPDGTVIQTPGYDIQTGILYRPRMAFARVETTPSLEDARGAATALLELVGAFPFATPADKLAWLCGLLTLVARPAVRSCTPFFAVDANRPGAGKSLLVDVASCVAFGRVAPRMPPADDPAELRKQVSAQLLAGAQIILVDNIPRGKKYGGPAFDAVLTAERWDDRELGRTSMLRMRATAVCWGTGNAFTPADDLARRTLRIRLASEHEHPEDRADLGGRNEDALRAHAVAQRFALVPQALTILRHHAAAGAPSHGPAWGTYAGWTSRVADAVRALGWGDPLEARASRDAVLATDDSDVYAVAAALAEAAGEGWVSAREFTDFVWLERPGISDAVRAARDIIADKTRTMPGRIPSTIAVGLYLRRWRGSTVGGRKILCEQDPATRSARYRAG